MEDTLKPGGSLKLPTNTVYIFNMSEDVWPFIKAISDEEAKHKEIEENADLRIGIYFRFAAKITDFYFTSSRASEQFLNYYTSLFGKQNFRILVPNTP